MKSSGLSTAERRRRFVDPVSIDVKPKIIVKFLLKPNTSNRTPYHIIKIDHTMAF